MRFTRCFFISIVLFVSIMGLSCQKGTTVKNPCDSVLSEGPLPTFGILLYDKETGDNIILTKKLLDTNQLKASYISSPMEIPKLEYHVLYNGNVNHALNGIVVFYYTEKEGQYLVNIKLPDIDSIKFSYEIKKVDNETNNSCGSKYYYRFGELKAVNYAYEEVSNSTGSIKKAIKIFL